MQFSMLCVCMLYLGTFVTYRSREYPYLDWSVVTCIEVVGSFLRAHYYLPYGWYETTLTFNNDVSSAFRLPISAQSRYL